MDWVTAFDSRAAARLPYGGDFTREVAIRCLCVLFGSGECLQIARSFEPGNVGAPLG